MLGAIRKALTSWFVIAFLGLLVVAFIVTGIGDPFGGIRAGSVARVGGEEITAAEFQQQFDRLIEIERQQNPTVTARDLAEQGGVEQVVQLMISGRALDIFAREVGLAASLDQIEEIIRSTPAFQIAGQFNTQRFEGLLAQQRITPREFQDGLASDIKREQLIATAQLYPVFPTKLAVAYAGLLLEQREGSIGLVPSRAFIQDVPSPTDEQVEAYYNEIIDSVTTPEQRSFQYVVVTPEIGRERVTISDEDIERALEQEQGADEAERRTLRQVLVADAAEAKRVAEAVAGGASLLAAGQLVQPELTESDLEIGTVTEVEFAADINEDVAEAVFDAEGGDVVGPERSAFGYHIIEVAEVQQPEPVDRDELRKAVVDRLTAEFALDEVIELTNSIEDELAEGRTLADVAEEHGLEIETAGPITGDEAGLIIPPTVVSTAFDQELDAEPMSHALPDDGGYAFVDVTEIIPPEARPLADVKQQVMTAWSLRQMRLKSEAAAAEIAKEVEAGTSLADALKSRNLPPPQDGSFRRLDIAQAQGKVPPPVVMMFSTAEGEVQTLPVPNNEGTFVVHVRDVTEVVPEANNPLVVETQRQFEAGQGQEIAGAFASAVRNNLGAEVNEAAIAAVRDQYLGAGAAELDGDF